MVPVPARAPAYPRCRWAPLPVPAAVAPVTAAALTPAGCAGSAPAASDLHNDQSTQLHLHVPVTKDTELCIARQLHAYRGRTGDKPRCDYIQAQRYPGTNRAGTDTGNAAGPSPPLPLGPWSLLETSSRRGSLGATGAARDLRRALSPATAPAHPQPPQSLHSLPARQPRSAAIALGIPAPRAPPAPPAPPAPSASSLPPGLRRHRRSPQRLSAAASAPLAAAGTAAAPQQRRRLPGRCPPGQPRCLSLTGPSALPIAGPRGPEGAQKTAAPRSGGSAAAAAAPPQPLPAARSPLLRQGHSRGRAPAEAAEQLLPSPGQQQRLAAPAGALR
nr:translation initiation factor IF-2-like [Taeniopygia guttata]